MSSTTEINHPESQTAFDSRFKGGGINSAVSPRTWAIFGEVERMRRAATPSASTVGFESPGYSPSGDPDLEQQHQAYNAVAAAKIWTASVAAHINDVQRRRLFAQLDRLHDLDEWEEGDKPATLASFVSFLRAMLLLKPNKWPNLGMSHGGRILASWGTAEDHITLDFYDNDSVVWSLTRKGLDGKTVSSVGKGSSLSFREHLEGFAPGHWFDA